MPFQKGNNANPLGAWSEKPFRDALRMEIASAGGNHKALRKIAAKLIKEAEAGNMAAITEIANRLDGKPAQETALTVHDKRDATDWTRAELVALLLERGASPPRIDPPGGRIIEADPVH